MSSNMDVGTNDDVKETKMRKKLILLNERPSNPSPGSVTKFSGHLIKINTALGSERKMTIPDFWKTKKLPKGLVIDDQGFVPNPGVKKWRYVLANGMHITIKFSNQAKILRPKENQDLITPPPPPTHQTKNG
ncbi:hypothetical protein CsSME_00034386 [Camellia sinensis var. sinensis]